ncbi:HNH endonuclease [Methylophaga sulfidovorans]|uniref:5-methylcytosine-specific restriction enzyme A n=1 Tax=Methylophaga sulfidovorans TaxID=45496 RepID=A0A1I3V212_9GAMM|nr:HNH endonuclease [Methylophaga sulfidovorans]SFJ89170.1 5-methylcytosine-specific restriction enzyme A [Methylophaga sulfidovorans]
MTSRKQFIESVGANCKNWNWSWSFVNHDQKFVIFGLWDINTDGLIFDNDWKGPGRKQSLEHIKLIEHHGYKLKIFNMKLGKTKDGRVKIKSFDEKLEDKSLVRIQDDYFAFSRQSNFDIRLAEEVTNPQKYIEGATKKISINAYERSLKARTACIEYYGCNCYICGFNFHKTYGDIGEGFIHVHHEKPLGEIQQQYEVDAINDLKPICPNCHAMIHRISPALPISELKKRLTKTSN